VGLSLVRFNLKRHERNLKKDFDPVC
jgi:hypothetical protein